MNLEHLRAGIGRVWNESIVDRLQAYIPNLSPQFDVSIVLADHARSHHPA